ncbi:MAG: NAD(P)-dependent oxidoreductase [Candidatus Omnitrophota bacterium]|nr:MAG: NAD(P)-dependent oxidoreductase [Candidatus Omnitrophota bacterium]
MKVVVFGGSGFLGSYVVDALLAEGYDTFVFDNKKSEHLKDSSKMITKNILDEEAVIEAVKGADIVYNFAAIADIDECIQHPLDAVKDNILGNTIILEACVKAKVKRFMFASSIYVYSATGGIYRSTKQACESLIDDYYKFYGLNFTILRYGTPYGPRADEQNSVYRFLEQAIERGKIEYYGDGSEVREYIHASDAARLSVRALDKQHQNECVLITGSHPVRITELFTMINEILNKKIRVEYSKKGIKSLESHYQITPYSYNPKIAKKLMDDYYLDLGQGLLECIEEFYKSRKGEK